MIQRPNDLTEASFADNFEYFVAISDVVVQDFVVAAVLVVVAAVVRGALLAVDLGRVLADVPDLWVAFHLLPFILGQLITVVFQRP